MNGTAKIILTTVIVAVLVGMGIAAKLIWFPTVKDAWFQGNGRQLRQVPIGLVVVRTTHFPHAHTNDISINGMNHEYRAAGRNVTFQELMSIAYQYNPGRISLPPGAPKNNFDFVLAAPQERLKAAVLKETGYSAHTEQQDTDVLALKVEDPNSQGLTLSALNEKDNSNFKNGRLYFTHVKLHDVTDGLEGILKTPVVDETGLTNYYDFSMAWSRGMNPNNLTQDQLSKIIGAWGLGLETDTKTIEMLVVKRGS